MKGETGFKTRCMRFFREDDSMGKLPVTKSGYVRCHHEATIESQIVTRTGIFVVYVCEDCYEHMFKL